MWLYENKGDYSVMYEMCVPFLLIAYGTFLKLCIFESKSGWWPMGHYLDYKYLAQVVERIPGVTCN